MAGEAQVVEMLGNQIHHCSGALGSWPGQSLSQPGLPKDILPAKGHLARLWTGRGTVLILGFGVCVYVTGGLW